MSNQLETVREVATSSAGRSTAEYDLSPPAPWISAASAAFLGRQQAWHDVRTAAPLLMLDMLTVSMALMAAIAGEALLGTEGFPVNPAFWLGAIGLTALVQHVHGLYPACGVPQSVEFRRLLRTCLMVIPGIGVGIILYTPLSRFPFVGFAIVLTVLVCALPVLRVKARKLLSHLNWWAQPVLIVGKERQAADLLDRLSGSRSEGLRPLGITFDPREHWELPTESREHHVGPVTDLESILIANRTCRVAVADIGTARALDFYTYRGIPHVTLPTDLVDHPTEETRLREGENRIELHCRSSITSHGALCVKRMMDVGLIVLFSPVLLPVSAMISLAIKLSSVGTILYGQDRVGRQGKPFRAWKFRSMVPDADARLQSYLEAHPELRSEWERTHKLRTDPRVTRVGGFLRRTSLDELPQLWNVLVGEMSLVGPRPIVDSPEYDREYIDGHPQVFELYTLVRPGITGLWQISGRNHTTYKRRVDCDRFYVQNWSCTLDIYILWRTVKTAVLQEGAY